MCISPKLIAAYHVLHRLQEPRHPPCALIYFLYLSFYLLNSNVFFQYVKELVSILHILLYIQLDLASC
jgi:hypothetical protein